MAPTPMSLGYGRWLDEDPVRALREGGLHFENDNAVHKTLRKIARRLDELNIPYALAGAMAMFFHGYRRFTEDIDLVVTPSDLAKIHEHLDGLGYVRVVPGGKNLRDAEFGVKIDFLKTGEFPGDGKPKPVVFPSPLECAQSVEGVPCVSLPKLVELKLASGMSPSRRKDLGDVQEMVKALHLPAEFAARLDPFVRDLYTQLWRESQEATDEA